MIIRNVVAKSLSASKTSRWTQWAFRIFINDADETRTAAIAFRKVDEQTIEVHLFSTDDSGNVGDSADYTFQMTRVKE